MSTPRLPTAISSAQDQIADFVEDKLLEGVDLEHKPLWMPNPGRDGRPNPQQLAIESEADELFYGGAAGGGKTDLLVGLALTRHNRTVIFRRVSTLLTAIIDRLEDVTEHNVNKMSKQLRMPGRFIELGSMKDEKDKRNWQGQPHDLIAFDEITEFTKTQYIFVLTWNRTTIVGQRCRVVVAGNPPTDEAGSWVVEEWAPWLDDEFPQPAKPGELRWYVRDGDRLVWSDKPGRIEVNGEKLRSRSRTFIPAMVEDNPHLMRDDTYLAVLESLPAELRAAFREGDFSALREPNPWQVIPTEWVRAAQRRWLEMDEPEDDLSGMGMDVARGGKDRTSVGWRRKFWYNVKAWEGRETPTGPTAAMKLKQVVDKEGNPPYVNIDVIGVGSSAYDSAEAMYSDQFSVVPVNVGAGSEYTDRSGALKMKNLRAEMYWRMRDSLDLEYGDDVALPPGNEVLADLCSATYKVQAGGTILVESKDDIKERIGRSPDMGEAIMLTGLPPNIPPPPASATVNLDISIYKAKRGSRRNGHAHNTRANSRRNRRRNQD